MRPVPLALGLAVLGSLAPAQAPMPRLSPSGLAQWGLRARWVAEAAPALTSASAAVWRTATGQGDLPPAFDGVRLLLVHAGPKKLQALDPASGRPLWEAPFTGLLDSPPQLAGPWVLCPLEGGRVALLDPATGAMRQLLRLPAWAPSGEESAPSRPRMLFPLLAGNTLVAGWTSPTTEPRPERSLFAFDATSGALRWSAPLPAGSEIHPLHHGGLVLAAGGGQATAFRLADGRVAWTTRLARRATLESGQLISGRLLLRTAQELVALDATTGQLIWTQPLADTSLLLGSGDLLVLTATKGTFNPETWVMALDGRSGRMVWEREVLGARLPWIQGDLVLVNDGEDVLGLDRITGRERWRRGLGGPLLAPLQPQGPAVLALFRAKGQVRVVGLRVSDGAEAFALLVPDRPTPAALMSGPQGLFLPLPDGGLVAYR